MYARSLSKEEFFWRHHVLEVFTKKLTFAEMREFRNLFESNFSTFVEGHLKKLVEDLEAGRVDTTLTLEQGMTYLELINSRFICKEIRKNLGTLFYPAFAVQIAKINGDEFSGISFKQGMWLQDLIDYEEIDDNLRDEIRLVFYPTFITQLIKDLQSGLIDTDDVSCGDFGRLQKIIDSDVDPEQCSLLCSLIYGADERNERE